MTQTITPLNNRIDFTALITTPMVVVDFGDLETHTFEHLSMESSSFGGRPLVDSYVYSTAPGTWLTKLLRIAVVYTRKPGRAKFAFATQQNADAFIAATKTLYPETK